MKLLLLLFDFLQKVLDAAALNVLIQFESGHKALAILTLNGDEGTDSFSMDDELVKGVFLVWVVALLASFISEEGTVEAEVLLKLRQCVILRLIIWADNFMSSSLYLHTFLDQSLPYNLQTEHRSHSRSDRIDCN